MSQAAVAVCAVTGWRDSADAKHRQRRGLATCGQAFRDVQSGVARRLTGDGVDLWNEREVLCDLLDTVEQSPAQRLDRCELSGRPAVYVWSYCRDRPTHGRRHLELYQQYLRDSGWPVYVGSAASGRARRGRHLNTLAQVRDIGAADVEVVALTMPSHAAALYAEALLQRAYRPLWNEPWLSGLGSSRDQGRARRTQRRSAFAVVHGRTGCGTGQPLRTYDELIELIEAHLAETVGDVRWLRLAAGS